MNYAQPYIMNPMMSPYNYQSIYQPMQQTVQQPIQKPQQVEQIYRPQVYLQGKSVDSIDVVKAMDIPLNGTISYFPLTDGSAIVTKQLQQDGTSKTMIYKPVEENKPIEENNYITREQMEQAIQNIDYSDIENNITYIKKQIQGLMENMKKINDTMNSKRKELPDETYRNDKKVF